jgi:hypothetical protein
MKMRFSKAIAAVLAASVVVVSGFSAMAAVTVSTGTKYQFTGEELNGNVTIESTVTDTDNKGKQVTYLVSKGSGEDIDITYIDQTALDSLTGVATFSFDIAKEDLYDLDITARFGSDANYEEGTLPTFTFKDGFDYYDNGTSAVTDVEAVEGDGGVTYSAKLTGDASDVVEYGIVLTNGTNTYHFPAKGTLEDGTFVVVIEGFDTTGYEAEGYVSDVAID